MEPEKRTSKLLKAEKSMTKRNGELVQYSQESEFNGTKRLYYYHILTFENGDKGNARSVTPDGSFNVGHRYSYQKRVFENSDGRKNTFFSYLKDLDKPAFSGKSFNPEQQKEILNQVALIAANTIMKFIDDDYLSIYETFRKWLYEKVIEKKEESRSISGIIKIATAYFAELEHKVTTEKVLKFADKLLIKVKDTSWKSQSQTNTENSSLPESDPLFKDGQPTHSDSLPF